MKNERKEGYEDGYGKGYGKGYGNGYGNGYGDGAQNTKVELVERKMKSGMSFEQACAELGFNDEEISICRAKMTLPH